MSTPKKRRLREQADAKQFVPFEPVVLDNELFDEMDQADVELSHWRWPGRSDE